MKGQVKVLSYAESPDAFKKGNTLYLKDKGGALTPLLIKSVASYQNNVILDFSEIKDAEGAKDLAGRDLFMKKEDLEELPEGEYYRYELIGLSVETVDGIKLGRVDDIFPTGSNDVLVVKEGKTEHLVPMLKEVIKRVDLGDGIMVIEPLEGMIEGI